MTQLLVATGNQGKLREYQRLLADTDYDIIGLAETKLTTVHVEETGTTFEENAIIKAQTYGEIADVLTIADDSGLAVDALEGLPGVYSARYGSADLDDAGRRAHLLDEMQGVPDDERTARFVCAIAVYNPATEQTETVRGTVEGRILHEDHDAGQGFGYDAVFQPDGYDKSFAELPMDAKNRFSHRGNAVEKLLPVLRQLDEE